MDTLITSDEAKLPAALRALLVEAEPLPAGVSFFEERFTWGTLARRLLAGIAMIGAGVIVLILGVAMLFSSFRQVTAHQDQREEWWLIGFGAVLAFAGWMFVSSLPAYHRLRGRQEAGEQTRYGFFLLPGALAARSFFDTTVIPRECFRSLTGGQVRYTFRGEEKSFALPREFIGTTPAALEGAIRSWQLAAAPA